MGVKLGDLVEHREILLSELSGMIIAFDAYNVMYQFLASIRTPEGHPLTSRDGRVVSHLKGLFSRNATLISKGVRPIFVFDGKPHELKTGTLKHRRERKEKALSEWQSALEEGDLERARMKAQQTSRLTEPMIEDARQLLKLMGIPIVQAPCEGEAQAAHICAKGEAHAVASQDFDALLFGASRLVRNLGLSTRRKLPGRKEWVDISPEMIDLDMTLSALGLTREQLVDIAILVGTDFNEGVRGIGPKKALALIKECKDLETAAKEERIPLLEWGEIREIFLRPNVTDDYCIGQNPIDDLGITKMLCDDLGFGRSGIERSIGEMMKVRAERPQSSLDNFV
jgi:flap endonuclease-1